MIQSLSDSMTQFLLLAHPDFPRFGALRAADDVWRDQDQELIVLFLFGTLRGEEAEARDFGKRGQTAQAPLLGRSDHSPYDRRDGGTVINRRKTGVEDGIALSQLKSGVLFLGGPQVDVLELLYGTGIHGKRGGQLIQAEPHQ